MVTSTVARARAISPMVAVPSGEREWCRDTSLCTCTVRWRDFALSTTTHTVSRAGTLLLAVVGGGGSTV